MSRDCSNFLDTPIIVSVGVVRESRKFSGHPYGAESGTTHPARSILGGTGSPGTPVLDRVVASVGSLPGTAVEGWLPGSSSSETRRAEKAVA